MDWQCITGIWLRMSFSCYKEAGRLHHGAGLTHSNNLTTLENMSHSFPTALLDDTAQDEPSHTPITTSWRPDHLLDRSERMRLREAASELNVYDLGWRRNIMSVLAPNETRRYRLSSILTLAWPLTAAPVGGEAFDYDDDKLEKMRRLTRRLRLADRAAEADEDMWEDA